MMEEYVDQSLKSAGYQWTSSEFFEWKKMMDDQKAHDDIMRRKDKISNRTTNGKFDRKNLLRRPKGMRRCLSMFHERFIIKHAKSTSGR